MTNQVHCPKCNSSQITAQKHGFSAGKAVAGAVTVGGIGLLAGLYGNSDIDITCLSCGYKWNPSKLKKETDTIKSQNELKDFNLWKKDFTNIIT